VAAEEPVEADASAEPAKSSAKKVNIDVETD